ncbi:hypothetical protein QAD02_002310 [Eretmocerus hayati]|uniref:Uncharacterized protein n=1 Tax=Eretmocerus hayati TaxID=131215 RepID=A0ACC2NKA1_9HYME|nr:hypothetical protein QAD02_002310 [Eretmocerus hayati]
MVRQSLHWNRTASEKRSFQTGTNTSNYPKSGALVNDTKFRRTLYKGVTSPGIHSVKRVYDEIKVKHLQAAARWIFGVCERTLTRWRHRYLKNQSLGKVETMVDFARALRSKVGKSLSKYSVGGMNHKLDHAVIKRGEKTHIRFFDRKHGQKFIKSTTFNIDASYKAAAKVCIPIFWALMSGKTAPDYISVFKLFNKVWPGMHPKIVICDYEKALHNAVRAFWNSLVKGCYFQYAQALFRQAAKKKILPKKHLQECKRKTQSKFNSFIKCFRDTWMKGYGPKILSVFRQVMRTNNGIESYHRKLNRLIINKLSATGFIKLLVKILQNYRVDYRSLVRGLRVSRRPKKFYVIKRRLIQNAWARYKNKDITGDELFQISTNLFSNFTDELDHTVMDLETADGTIDSGVTHEGARLREPGAYVRTPLESDAGSQSGDDSVRSNQSQSVQSCQPGIYVRAPVRDHSETDSAEDDCRVNDAPDSDVPSLPLQVDHDDDWVTNSTDVIVGDHEEAIPEEGIVDGLNDFTELETANKPTTNHNSYVRESVEEARTIGDEYIAADLVILLRETVQSSTEELGIVVPLREELIVGGSEDREVYLIN